MLEGYPLAFFLLAIGAVFIVAELLLPSHGTLGISAAIAILSAIFIASRQNTWAGLSMLVGVAAATPFVWIAFVKIWPKTPVGRRVVLPPVPRSESHPLVRIGQAGITISELRPIGVCEFDGTRVEAQSEHGMVAPGTGVRVIALVNNRPTVRIIS